MKNTNIHSILASRVFSLRENRLMYAWDVETGGGSADEAGKVAAKNMEKYKDQEMKKIPAGVRSAEQIQRAAFLDDSKPTDAGLYQVEQTLGLLKFGRDATGVLTLPGRQDHARLEKLLKVPMEYGEGAKDNDNGTYTLSTMVGGKSLSMIVDSVTYEALGNYASLNVDDQPEIARQTIPPKNPQKRAFIEKYKKAAEKAPSIMTLNEPNTVTAFGLDEYSKMVADVLNKRPDGVQYVMTEWAVGNRDKYISAWRNAVEAQAVTLKHLDTSKIAVLGNEYASLCIQAIGKDVNTLKFVDFMSDKLTDLQKQSIVRFAVTKGASKELINGLPNNIRSIVAKDKTSILQTREKLDPITNEDIQMYENPDFWIEMAPTFEQMIDQVKARPRIMTLVAANWPSEDKANYKIAWETAVKEYPGIIGESKTYSLLKKHLGVDDATEFYGLLAKNAVKKFSTGERRVDGSDLVSSINGEWSKFHPDSFRKLFLTNSHSNGNATSPDVLPAPVPPTEAYEEQSSPAPLVLDDTVRPTGDSSLLMLLTVPGAEEAFNSIDPDTRDTLGYARALKCALNEKNLATVLSDTRNFQQVLKRHLTALPGGMAKYNEVLAITLGKTPQLQSKVKDAENSLLDARFKDRVSVVQALDTTTNIFAGVNANQLEKYKDVVTAIMSDPNEEPAVLEKLFAQLPASLKTDEQVVKYVSANASVYKHLSPEQKRSIPILKSALKADAVNKGTIDWKADTTMNVRLLLGENKPQPEKVDELAIDLKKKVERKSIVDELELSAVVDMDARTAFSLMNRADQSPVSVLASLIKRGASIAKDQDFLTQASLKYSEVLKFVVKDKEAKTIQDDVEMLKDIVIAAIENSSFTFSNLTDVMKKDAAYLMPALKKWGVSIIMSKDSIGSDKNFAAALETVYGVKGEEALQKELANICTPAILKILSPAVRTSVLDANPFLASAAMEPEKRVESVLELMKQSQTTEQISKIKSVVSLLDIKSVAALIEKNPEAFAYLSRERQFNPDILETTLKGKRTEQINKTLQTYLKEGMFDAHSPIAAKQYPLLVKEYGKMLDAEYEENTNFDKLVSKARGRQQEFIIYGDQALAIEDRPEHKKYLPDWIKHTDPANAAGLNALMNNVDDEKALEEKVKNMDVILDVQRLVGSGKIEWTDNKLNEKVTDASQTPVLVREMSYRIFLVNQIASKKPKDTAEAGVFQKLVKHHQKNIVLLAKKIASFKQLPGETADSFLSMDTTGLDRETAAKVMNRKESFALNRSRAE